MRRLRHDTSGRILAGLIVTLGLLVPLAVFGAPALARTGASASQYEYSSSAQYQYRITICHHTHSRKHPWHTIRVSVRAWPAHERHGDDMGACGTQQLSSKHHGHKGHGHDASSNAKSFHGNGQGQNENGQGNKSHGHGDQSHGQGNKSHGHQGSDD